MLEINLRRVHLVAVLDLTGNIDIDASNFIEKVGWCLENGYKDILCNFENVSFIDYAGLSVLAIAYKNILNHGARIKFATMSVHVKKVLCLVCMDRVLEIYEDEQSAIKSFEEDRAIAKIQKTHLRRRFKRLPLDMTIEYKSKALDDALVHGKVLNISAVGLLVFSHKVYPLGEILSVKLTLMPKPGELEVECKVAWLVQKEIQPQIYPAMGLEFYHLNNETQKKIVEFVDRNLPLSCSFEGS